MMRKRLSTGVFDTVPEELQRLPPLVIDILGRVVVPVIFAIGIWLAVLLGGCATMPKPDLGRAVKAGTIAMGVVRESARVLEDAHHVATDAAIAGCRATLPADADQGQREDCLARAGFSPSQIEQHQRALDKLGEAYDAIAGALELMDEAEAVLGPMLENAEELATP